jgi:hypothetical protein
LGRGDAWFGTFRAVEDDFQVSVTKPKFTWQKFLLQVQQLQTQSKIHEAGMSLPG